MFACFFGAQVEFLSKKIGIEEGGRCVFADDSDLSPAAYFILSSRTFIKSSSYIFANNPTLLISPQEKMSIQ